MGPLSVIMRHKQERDTEIFKFFFFLRRRKTEVFVGRNNIVIKYVFIVHCGVRQEMNYICLSHDRVTLDVGTILS